jgi:hypothetical protein
MRLVNIATKKSRPIKTIEALPEQATVTDAISISQISAATIESSALEILHPSLYRGEGDFENGISFLKDPLPAGRHSTPLEKIAFLLGAVDAADLAYSRYFFDTDLRFAWKKNPLTEMDELAGGYYSPGFMTLIEAATSLYHRASQMKGDGSDAANNSEVHLNFSSHFTPPWGNFSSFVVNDSSVNLLRRLAEGDYQVGHRELDSSGLRAFFREGFRHEGRLMLSMH